MVQVDVFWSYGLSAGLALAGHKTIEKSHTWWDNPAFLFNVIWTACIFAPSGVFLLWTNPGWETMFVASDYSSIPAWLVTVFALTNVTQGILGFYITARFLRAGKWNAAVMQTVWAHLAMLAILVFGWDGQGYRRFFYAGSGSEWHSGVDYAWTQFFNSTIFFSLLGLGVIFIPTYFGLVKLLQQPARP